MGHKLSNANTPLCVCPQGATNSCQASSYVISSCSHTIIHLNPSEKENVTVFLAKNMLFAKNISISLLNSGSQLDPAQLNPSFSDVFLKLKGNIIATKKLQNSEHKKLKGTKCRIMSLAHKNPWNWGSIWLIWRSSHYSTMLLGPCLFPWVCYVSNKYPICSASWIRIQNVWYILAVN